MYHIHGASCTWYAVCSAKAQFQQEVWLVQLLGGPQIGKWYRLRIDVAGNEISYYIDDKLQHQVNDNLHKSGGVNLYAHDAIVEFDNVVITGDDIPDNLSIQHQSKVTISWGQLKRY
jgi:hypothetical protein